jgi:hypothetical protein
MNQVPEKLYLGQNLKQYVMKEAVIYKNTTSMGIDAM